MKLITGEFVRGSALGLITGWGGTQRLPRLIGKARALQMFCSAEKLHADEARDIGLINAIAEDPVMAAMEAVNSPRRGAEKYERRSESRSVRT